MSIYTVLALLGAFIIALWIVVGIAVGVACALELDGGGMTPRNWGMTDREALGGKQLPGPRGAEMSAEPKSSFSPAILALKEINLAQSARNVLDLVLLFLLFAVLCLSIPLSIGLLLFTAFRQF